MSETWGMSKKYRTIEQVETAQQRAVRFAQNVLLDDDKADELASLSPEEYADRKRIHVISTNPTERNTRTMPKPTRADLEQRVQELEQENSDLNERLDAIADLVGTAEESEDDEEEEQEDDEEDDE